MKDDFEIENQTLKGKKENLILSLNHNWRKLKILLIQVTKR